MSDLTPDDLLIIDEIICDTIDALRKSLRRWMVERDALEAERVRLRGLVRDAYEEGYSHARHQCGAWDVSDARRALQEKGDE